MADPRIPRRHEDPYAPPAARKAVPAPGLPTARMSRLGATARTVAACTTAFGRLGTQEQAQWADGWAVTDDGALDVELAGIDGLFGATITTVLGWTAGAMRAPAGEAMALTVALVIEEDRPSPRAQVRQRLVKAAGGRFGL